MGGMPADRQLSDTVIIGSAEELQGTPGSGAVLDEEDIRRHGLDDVNRVVRKIPGVYVREEDGMGLFPNLSLRGVDTNRSSKLTMMEDGILTAPAPYSAPSAYYAPTVGRMSGLEILKGSSQVRFGPHTTGGAVNYLSTPIPSDNEGYLKLMLGTDNDYRLHANYGGLVETYLGNVGFLGEIYYRNMGGFKEIDSVEAGGIDRDQTGFENIEPMLKLSWEPNSDRYQRFELKLGYTDKEADETYLGVTDEDFDPERRYAASRFDVIETDHTRNYLKHYLELTDAVATETTLYHNRFHRNWYKLNKVNGTDPSAALAANGTDLDTLRGTAAGELRVKANNRNYELYGVQNTTTWDLEQHELTLGLRYHVDSIRRYQWEDLYEQDSDGAIIDFTPQYKGPDEAGNRWQETKAFAAFLEDRISLGPLTLLPGIRYEHLDYEHIRYDKIPLQKGRGSLDIWAAGLGAVYDLDEQNTVFAGVYRGVSTPGPRANLASDIEEETSLALELGLRHDNSQGFQGELVLFHTSFDNLFVDGNVGGTGSGDSDNAGDVISKGVELRAIYDAGIANNWRFSNPYFLALTYTDATLDGDASSTDPESIFANGKDGNRVPYIPELQLTIGTGFSCERWGAEIQGVYVDSTYTTADNVESSSTDARFGKTDDYFVVDVSTWYNLSDTVKLTASVRNLFDEQYIVSRHPHGPRGGRPINALAGIEIRF